MVQRRDATALISGTGRGLVLALGVVLLVVGAFVLSTTLTAGPLYGLAAGVVASLLGIELITFGLTGRRFP